jgi:hypothetical protein
MIGPRFSAVFARDPARSPLLVLDLGIRGHLFVLDGQQLEMIASQRAS